MYKLLSLNVSFSLATSTVIGYNFLSRNVFLAGVYQKMKTEWGGKIVSSHGSSHSRGVMILFKPRLDVDLEKITADNFGRCILAGTVIDGTKVVLVNIYAPNDATQQVVFLRDVAKEFLILYANDNLVLGGDFNYTNSTLDKKAVDRPIDSKKHFNR